MKSQWEGKCKGMKTADGLMVHSWKVNDEIFYQKNPKCICINEACFKKQQEEASGAASPSPGSPPTTLPPRSESERTEDCSHMIEILWSMADKKVKAIIKDNPGELENKDIIILKEVFFKGLVETWNRE